MEQTAEIGDAVIFTDSFGRDHHAVITNGFGSDGRIRASAAINVAFVSKDTSRLDSYGRQIERESSVQHQHSTTTHGRFWRFADEAKRETSAPGIAQAQA